MGAGQEKTVERLHEDITDYLEEEEIDQVLVADHNRYVPRFDNALERIRRKKENTVKVVVF